MHHIYKPKKASDSDLVPHCDAPYVRKHVWRRSTSTRCSFRFARLCCLLTMDSEPSLPLCAGIAVSLLLQTYDLSYMLDEVRDGTYVYPRSERLRTGEGRLPPCCALRHASLRQTRRFGPKLMKARA